MPMHSLQQSVHTNTNGLGVIFFFFLRSAGGPGPPAPGLDPQFPVGAAEVHECDGGSGQDLPAPLRHTSTTVHTGTSAVYCEPVQQS